MGTYSTPIKNLFDRLVYHTTAGQMPLRLLDGWKFEPVPRQSVEGLTDLPAVSLYIPNLTATFRPTRQEEMKMSVNLLVSVKRDSGDDSLVQLIQAVELVMDAINYDETGALKPVIKGTLKPFSWSMTGNFVVDTSLNGQVSISLDPRIVELGRRRI
jgi:hypothetical protein